MVVGQQMPERPEPDVLGEWQRLGDEQVGRRARFPRCREMLSYPGLREAETVQSLDFLQNPAMTLEYRPLGWMRRHQQVAKIEPSEYTFHSQLYQLTGINTLST